MFAIMCYVHRRDHIFPINLSQKAITLEGVENVSTKLTQIFLKFMSIRIQ